MDLFGKKKAKAAPPPAAKPAPVAEAQPPEAPKEAYVPKAAEEIHQVEKNIDFFLERKSTLGILERYKDKYGEDLSPPEVTDGVKYKYTFAEEAPPAKRQAAPAGTVTATAKPADAKAGVPVATATTKPAQAGAGGAAVTTVATAPAEKKPATAGLTKAFSSLTGSGGGEEKARAPAPSMAATPAEPKRPAPPGFFYSGEDRPITGDSVMLCLLAGKPFWAWRGFLKYKCRNPPPVWMMVVGELPLFPVTFITGIVRLPARGIYEVVQASKRRKEEKAKYEAEYEEKRRLAYEKRLAAGAPMDDEYEYQYSPPRRRPPPRRGPPPRDRRRRRPMRA